jgi:hypothetical protein
MLLLCADGGLFSASKIEEQGIGIRKDAGEISSKSFQQRNGDPEDNFGR